MPEPLRVALPKLGERAKPLTWKVKTSKGMVAASTYEKQSMKSRSWSPK